MIRSRGAVLLAASLLLGIAALWLAGGTLGAGAAAPAPADPLVRLLVARRDLAPGTRLEVASVEWRPWPTAALHPDYLVEGQAQPADVQGRLLRDGVRRGTPLSRAQLAPAGTAGPVGALLAPGRRAIAIAVSAAAGVGGLLQPGDRVDVILTATTPAGEGFARTVATGVRIVGIDRRLVPDLSADDPSGPGTVTLDVGPGEAEAIALAQDLGRLSLALATGPGRAGVAVSQRDLTGGLLPAAPTGALATLAASLPPVAPLPAVPSPPAAPVAVPSGPAPAGPSRVERVHGVDVVRGSRAPAPPPTPAAGEGA
jgi:pilus assembly protein CpaB